MSAQPPHGEHEAQPTHSRTSAYVAVQIVSMILTVAAFYGVVAHWLPAILLPFILALAAVQLGLQAILFMHLNLGRRVFAMFFGIGLGLAGLIGVLVMVLMNPAWASTGVPQPPQQAASTPAPSTPPAKGHGQTPATPSTPPPTGGSALALQIIQQKCEVCHTLNGTGATIGPNLNLVMEGKVNLVPGGQPRNPTWLAAWITNPHRYLSTAIMPAGLVSGSQLEAVVKYLTTQVK